MESEQDYDHLSDASSMDDLTFNFLNYKFKNNKLSLKITFLEQQLQDKIDKIDNLQNDIYIYKKDIYIYKSMYYIALSSTALLLYVMKYFNQQPEIKFI